MSEADDTRNNVIETANKAIKAIDESINELYKEYDNKNKFLFRCRVVSLLFATHFNVNTEYKWEIKNE